MLESLQYEQLWPLSPLGAIPAVRMLGRMREVSHSRAHQGFAAAIGDTLADLDALATTSLLRGPQSVELPREPYIRCPYMASGVVGCGGNETHDGVLLFGAMLPARAARRLLGNDLRSRILFSAEAGAMLNGSRVWALDSEAGDSTVANGLGSPDAATLVVGGQACAASAFGIMAAGSHSVDTINSNAARMLLLWAACVGPPDVSKARAADVLLRLPDGVAGLPVRSGTTPCINHTTLDTSSLQ